MKMLLSLILFIHVNASTVVIEALFITFTLKNKKTIYKLKI